MATVTSLSVMPKFATLETPATLPRPQRLQEFQPNPKVEDRKLASSADPSAASCESLRDRLRIEPAKRATGSDLADVCSLLLLLLVGAASLALPAVMAMNFLSAMAQFSSMEVVRMLAGMP